MINQQTINLPDPNIEESAFVYQFGDIEKATTVLARTQYHPEFQNNNRNNNRYSNGYNNYNNVNNNNLLNYNNNNNYQNNRNRQNRRYNNNSSNNNQYYQKYNKQQNYQSPYQQQSVQPQVQQHQQLQQQQNTNSLLQSFLLQTQLQQQQQQQQQQLQQQQQSQSQVESFINVNQPLNISNDSLIINPTNAPVPSTSSSSPSPLYPNQQQQYIRQDLTGTTSLSSITRPGSTSVLSEIEQNNSNASPFALQLQKQHSQLSDFLSQQPNNSVGLTQQQFNTNNDSSVSIHNGWNDNLQNNYSMNNINMNINTNPNAFVNTNARSVPGLLNSNILQDSLDSRSNSLQSNNLLFNESSNKNFSMFNEVFNVTNSNNNNRTNNTENTVKSTISESLFNGLGHLNIDGSEFNHNANVF